MALQHRIGQRGGTLSESNRPARILRSLICDHASLLSLSQQCCLRSHHSLMPPVPHRLNGMCAATTRRRAVSRCAPWPVVDPGPLGPAASSMSPTRFTVLGVKVSASPRRVHRWRTSACPRSSLGCLLPSLPSQSQPCLPPSQSQLCPLPCFSHNHAPPPPSPL